jgi:hypothetical protein
MQNMQGVNEYNRLMSGSGDITALGSWVSLCRLSRVSELTDSISTARRWSAQAHRAVHVGRSMRSPAINSPHRASISCSGTLLFRRGHTGVLPISYYTFSICLPYRPWWDPMHSVETAIVREIFTPDHQLAEVGLSPGLYYNTC